MAALVPFLGWVAAAAAVPAPREHAPAIVRWGTEPIKVSTVAEGNTLPSFFWQAGSEEGGAYTVEDGYAGGLGAPRPFIPPDNCPDDIFENRMEDMRVPVLPWRNQDTWGCERTPTDVPVIVMENEYLRASVTPQWGGKIWAAWDKKANKPVFFNNPAHQPNNIGYRKAWTSGGSEWNWGPGYIGHSVFTESPTWAAIINTSRGEVVRVWEYDRLNRTTWQVDMFLDGPVLWVHPAISNPNPTPRKGYWWTCVAMPVTDTDRIVAPATESVTPCTPWPFGAHTLNNVTFRGPDVNGCAARNGGAGGCAWEQDMSFLGNIPSAHDFFFRIAKPQQPYIAHTRQDGYTVVHAHPLNGTKFFTWGMAGFGMFQQDFMSASDYENPKCGEVYDPWCEFYEHKGRYTELQIGPAPTQMHTFPIAEKSTYQWTEWFKAFSADPTEMHDADYNVPLRKVAEWMDGPDGVAKSTTDSLDRFFAELAQQTPKQHEIVSVGMPWGGLEEHAFGGRLGNGTWFNLSVTDETRPWVELASDGTFSAETLERTPLNFEISPRWLEKLEASVAAGHDTWLHQLFLGTIFLEQGDVAKAKTALTKSLEMRPHPITARNLATFAGVAPALAYYQMAWGLWKEIDESKDPAKALLGRDLLSEYAIWLTYQGKVPELDALLGDPDAAAFFDFDRVLHARAWLAVQKGDHASAIAMIRGHCFPTYGNDRAKLLQMWLQAHLQAAQAELGRNLTLMDTVRVRRKLGCAGDSDTLSEDSGQCNRGPPNIGYPY